MSSAQELKPKDSKQELGSDELNLQQKVAPLFDALRQNVEEDEPFKRPSESPSENTDIIRELVEQNRLAASQLREAVGLGTSKQTREISDSTDDESEERQVIPRLTEVPGLGTSKQTREISDPTYDEEVKTLKDPFRTALQDALSKQTAELSEKDSPEGTEDEEQVPKTHEFMSQIFQMAPMMVGDELGAVVDRLAQDGIGEFGGEVGGNVPSMYPPYGGMYPFSDINNSTLLADQARDAQANQQPDMRNTQE